MYLRWLESLFSRHCLGSCSNDLHVEVTPQALDLTAVERVVTQDGHYLAERETLRRMKSDYVYPALADRQSVDDWIEDVLPLTNHVHLSVPWLNPLSEFAAEVKQFIFTLDQAGWEGWVSIEMRSAFEALPDTLDLCNAAIGQAS